VAGRLRVQVLTNLELSHLESESFQGGRQAGTVLIHSKYSQHKISPCIITTFAFVQFLFKGTDSGGVIFKSFTSKTIF
jgi:hypothetical protein